MSTKPKLLFLSQTLPYPLDGGVWIRTFNVYRLLANAYDVTMLCFERMGESWRRYASDLKRANAELSRFGRVEVFRVPQNHSQRRLAWNHLRSITNARVYTNYIYESEPFRARLRELLASGEYDLIHADSMDLSGYFHECSELPLVCVHHNVESELLLRRSRVAGGYGRQAYFALQGRLMEREERRWVPKVNLNVAVSEHDRRALSALCPGARIEIVPNGVDIDEFKPETGSEDGIVYIGGTNWFPNLDALDYLCAEILPHLRRSGLRFPIRWVGSASAEEKERYALSSGVELTGYVDDVRPYMRDSFAHIVPLRAGGGTRLKILNSWAMGKAVVTTTVGCEGLDAVDGYNALIRDNPADFAQAILELMRDPTLRLSLGANARDTAERTYSWKVIGERMSRLYHNLLVNRNE